MLSLPEVKVVHQLHYYCNHLAQVKSWECQGDQKPRSERWFELLQKSSQGPLLRDTPPLSGSEVALARPSRLKQAYPFCSIIRQLLEARDWGAGTRRQSGVAGGLSGARAARLQLRSPKPRVTRRRSAFQERGSAAARTPTLPEPSASHGRPQLRAAQLLSMLGFLAAPTRAFRPDFLSWFEKRRMDKWVQG